MSATSVWDAPSGECLRGRGRYGVCLSVRLSVKVKGKGSGFI